MFNFASVSPFYKRILQYEYNRRYREKNLDKFREYARKQIAKWRAANPELARELGRKHQLTWRTKNLDLNRYRAKHGMRARKMYNELLKLMKG